MRSNTFRRQTSLATMLTLLLMLLILPNMLPDTAFAQTKFAPCLQGKLCSFARTSQIAFAQAGTLLTVQKVWTRDSNGQDKGTFNHIDTIQYALYVNNSSSNPITATFHFEAFWGETNFGPTQIFDQIFSHITVPVGTTGYYTISSVPSTALAGLFTIRVLVHDENSVQNSDGKTGLFTVNAGKLVIPATGTVYQLFLDNCQKCTHEKWYPSYYDQNDTLQSRPTGGVHSGVDISSAVEDCLTSKPIYAAEAGLVIWAGWAVGFGWSVVLKHGYGFRGRTRYIYTLYGHMGTAGTDPKTSNSCLQVQVNDKTDNQTLLGYQGSSGLPKAATHVHFTIFAGSQDASTLSSPYDLVNTYSDYPASPDFYLCMPLTLGDASTLDQVNQGDNKC